MLKLHLPRQELCPVWVESALCWQENGKEMLTWDVHLCCSHSRLFRMLLMTTLLNPNKNILSCNYMEYCQCLHPSAQEIAWHGLVCHWRAGSGRNSCPLLRFPSLAIKNRPSWCKCIWMTGKREASSPSLGCCFRFPSLNTNAARKPAFPSKVWYLHTAAVQTEVICPCGGKKILSAHSGRHSNSSQQV